MRAAHLIWTVLAVMAFGLLGCAYDKAASPSYAGDYGGMEEERYAEADAAAYGGGGGDGMTVYDFEDDVVDGEYLAPEGASLSSRGRSKQANMVDVRGSFDAPGPTAAGKKDEAKPEPRTTTKTRDGSREPPPQSRRRQVIYTANMHISVFRVEDAVDFAEALPQRLGGWVQERADNLIILRVPAARLDEAMELLGEQGVVEERTLEALDVTNKYTDLESRIRILVETQAQLKKLLDKAKTVEQALEVRKALDAVTMELELARARMRELSSSIAFSTLIVRFTPRGPVDDVPSSNDPFPWVINLGVESTEYR